jgi:hypothetical protein
MSHVPRPISERLQPGEDLLWWGQPSVWGFVSGGLVLTWPLGLVALGSAVWWVGWMVPERLPSWTWAVLGLVLLFSFHMLLLRPLLSRLQATRTYYAITNRRALVVCRFRKELLQEMPHEQGELVVVDGPGRLDKIQFGRTAASTMEVLVFGRAAIPGFYGLEKFEEAVQILQQQREHAGD